MEHKLKGGTEWMGISLLLVPSRAPACQRGQRWARVEGITSRRDWMTAHYGDTWHSSSHNCICHRNRPSERIIVLLVYLAVHWDSFKLASGCWGWGGAVHIHQRVVLERTHPQESFPRRGVSVLCLLKCISQDKPVDNLHPGWMGYSCLQGGSCIKTFLYDDEEDDCLQQLKRVETTEVSEVMVLFFSKRGFK